MNRKLIDLSQRYVKALRKHLRLPPKMGMQTAKNFGVQAVDLGLETLDLARIHEHALVTLKLSKGESRLIKRAGIFFTEALIPIVETRCFAIQTLAHPRKESLLQRGAGQRKSSEPVLNERGARYFDLLKKSLQLQGELRQLTHQLFTIQESDRKKISGELQNEIVQILLSLNVRLASLKQEARNDMKSFKNEIAVTQQVVVKSARIVRRMVGKLREI